MQIENIKSNIPAEMREFDQWLAWRMEMRGDKATKVPYNVANGERASASDPTTWASFDDVVAALENKPDDYQGIGFVLSDTDPFTAIDLDDPSGIEDETDRNAAIQNLTAIYQNVQSYTETSPSGKGVHIIVKGSFEDKGRRKGKVEIYCEKQFMTMTGNVTRNLPIKEDQASIDHILKHIIGPRKTSLARNIPDMAEVYTDDEIITWAMEADNGDKFYDLWSGDFSEYGDNGQSEADMALVNILQFYTKNRGQIKRLFRASGLGRRAKANREDYVDAMIAKSFDREVPDVDLEELKANFERQIAENVGNMATVKNDLSADQNDMPTFTLGDSEADGIQFPPGLVGDIAMFIYRSAPRPVAEIAIAGALALMSGITGRTYNISGTGLNQYILLLAPTGTGKEAIASGTNRLMSTVASVSGNPEMMNFIGPSSIASAQGLHRHLKDESPSFVSILGEAGIMLKNMTGDRASESKAGLRAAFLDLYGKSGLGQTLSSSAYAKKEDSSKSMKSPAFSLVGESTQARFYEALTEDLIAEGLMPRFTVIEYHGLRPPLNENAHNVRPSADLVDDLVNLAGECFHMNKIDEIINVVQDDEAKAVFKAFNLECDKHMNASLSKSDDDDVLVQLWNRAHLKSLKLAAVVAAGMTRNENGQPVITKDVALWAIELVKRDVRAMTKRFSEGHVGSSVSAGNESNQAEKFAGAIRKFINSPAESLRSYGVSPKMHTYNVVPHSFLQRRCNSLAPFKNDKHGPTAALKRIIANAIDRGDLSEIPSAKMQNDFETSGKGYVIKNPHTWLE